VWRSVLGELSAMPGVRLSERGRADVWLTGALSELTEQRPLVVQVHEVGWRGELGATIEPVFAEHLERHASLALAAATRVITPSRAARAQVVDEYGFDPDRVHVVPHGVDHAQFRPELSGGREQIGRRYILFVGVLHRRKNLDALREAFAGLARRGFDHMLVAVANPPPDQHERPDLQARLQLEGLPGRVELLRGLGDDQLAALMAGADAFCLPSLFEGFGLPALEAMACGVPVVVSDRGALPEVVGDAGLVVEPTSSAIEAALRQLLEDRSLAERLGAAGARRAAAFSWRATAEGWLEVLRLAAREP
jgi:glycosyltransferase involved in cell wall biosynthesis